MGPPGGLAIDRDDRRRQQRLGHPGRHPVPVAGGKLLGIEQGEDPTEGVMRRDPMWAGEEGAQPSFLGPPPLGNLEPGVGPGNGGGEGDHHNLDQGVAAGTIEPGIMKLDKGDDSIGPVGASHEDPSHPTSRTVPA